MDAPGDRLFENHRGVTPLLWVFTSLACLELLGVHLFLSLTWPWLAWPLTALSGVTIFWLVRWIRSWKRLPHRLSGDALTLHMGSLRSMTVPLAKIEMIHTLVSDAVMKTPGTVRLVPVAYPNRLIRLTAPLADRRKTRQIAIRLDDPAAFDAAMGERGIRVGA